MNEASGGDGIPAEVFQILKDDAIKSAAFNMPANLQNLPKFGHRTGKGQFSFQSQRKAMPKSAQTAIQLHSSHMIAKQCSKSFKLSSDRTRTKNFQMY